MLIDVASDREFQKYLGTEEQRLYLRIWPTLTAFIRLTVSQNSWRAQQYFVERGQAVLLAAYRRIFEDQYRAIASNSKAWPPTQTDFMREMAWYLASKAGSRITGMSRTNVELISRIIMSKVQEGRPTAEIAREIQQMAPELSKARAATIARTEVHGASLAAIFESARYRRIGVRNKTWWTVRDEKVRPAHAAVHGQTVPFNEPFIVGGYEMQRPADENAPAAMTVNCRCSLLLNSE